MSMLIDIFMRFLCLLLVSHLWVASAFGATVTRIVDGDTLILENVTKVRLYGIDCPEGGQEAGDEATAEALRLTLGQQFTVEEQGLDRYRRTAAILYLPDGHTLQEGLLAAGVAWVAPRYCKRPECRNWKALEDAARQERRGLWRYPQPVPPWEWRKRTR